MGVRRAVDEEGAGKERAIGDQRCRWKMRTPDAAHGPTGAYLPVLADVAFKNHGAMMADDHQFEWGAKAGSFRRPDEIHHFESQAAGDVEVTLVLHGLQPLGLKDGAERVVCVPHLLDSPLGPEPDLEGARPAIQATRPGKCEVCTSTAGQLYGRTFYSYIAPFFDCQALYHTL